MRILVTGGEGMLAYALKQVFKETKHEILIRSKKELDISKNTSIQKTFLFFKPEVCINTAAFTDVDGAETKEKEAKLINGTALKLLALEAKKMNCFLIHYSTDYVFDGEKKQGYRENAKRNPINAYGKSKMFGERMLQKYGGRYAIIRTSWLFGPKGENFVDTMVKLANKNKTIKVVADQIGSPTYTIDLANATKKFLEKPKHGIFHLTNEGVTNWADFAREIFKRKKLHLNVIGCQSDAFPRPAKRPHYSILLNTKLPHLRSWKEGLKDYLRNF